MRKFKVGDFVRCVDADSSNRQLKDGWFYIISAVREDLDGDIFVGVEANEDAGWSSNRFKLVDAHKEEAPQVTECFIVVPRDSTGSSDGAGVMGQYETLEEAIKKAETEAMFGGRSMPWVVFKAVKAFERSSKEIPV